MKREDIVPKLIYQEIVNSYSDYLMRGEKFTCLFLDDKNYDKLFNELNYSTSINPKIRFEKLVIQGDCLLIKRIPSNYKGKDKHIFKMFGNVFFSTFIEYERVGSKMRVAQVPKIGTLDGSMTLINIISPLLSNEVLQFTQILPNKLR